MLQLFHMFSFFSLLKRDISAKPGKSDNLNNLIKFPWEKTWPKYLKNNFKHWDVVDTIYFWGSTQSCVPLIIAGMPVNDFKLLWQLKVIYTDVSPVKTRLIWTQFQSCVLNYYLFINGELVGNNCISEKQKGI